MAFIGAGNVATHLAKAFFELGIPIGQVYSRSIVHARQLAAQVNATPITTLSALTLTSVDLIVISVKDDAIEAVAQLIPPSSAIVVHTSGTKGMDVLAHHRQRGVFYPLQTFSIHRAISLSYVPFCIEGNSKSTTQTLVDLASSLSKCVRVIDTEKRQAIHVAAVFACNFTNHMLALASDILDQKGEGLDLLKPLVEETMHKAFLGSPKAVQTGPGVREDSK